jgi:tetratricopeptide (TPR) repeat protein
MGIVYAAYDPELDRKIALKLLRTSAQGPDATRQARLLREAQAMARISHPNVLAVHDVGMHRDQIFVAMEMVEGGTLTEWIEKTPRKLDQIIPVFVQAGRGLAAAHAAGLVHRDFKPENVLVGTDGRVRVTDFGLARLDGAEGAGEEEASARAESAIAGRLPSHLTQAGAVVGTPLYMSPEQAHRQTPDARSDQYSFAASLFWAIYGVPPIGPLSEELQSLERAYASTQDGSALEVPAPEPAAPPIQTSLPREPKLPGSLRRVLLRGLAKDPDHRYPSMDELLKDLSADPRTWQRRWLAGAAAAAVALAAVGTYQWLSSRQSELCRGADRKLAGVWDPQARAEVSRAFVASAEAGADRAAAKVVELLDGYAASWVAMHTDACEATRLRGEQTEALLSLRMICLDRRLHQMDALARLLRTADARMVDRSVEAALGLPPVAGCADVVALTSPSQLPEDTAVRAQVDQVSRALDEVRALYELGRFKHALEGSAKAVEEAARIGYSPLHAEALVWKGLSEERAGDSTAAERTLRRAVVAAESGRADLEKARALSRLVFVTGFSLGRFDEAYYWADLAQATLQHAPDDGVEFDLSMSLGATLGHQGRLEEALARYQRALEISPRSPGLHHPRRGLLLTNMAVMYQRLGRHEEALPLLEKSLEIISAARGPDHPSAAYAHYNLAVAQQQKGDLEAALRSSQEAIRIRRAALGPDHPEVASAMDNLATVLQAQGRFADALAESQRALALKKKALGEDHLDLSYSLENLGQAYLGLGQPDLAIPPLEQAIALRERAKLEAGELAEARFALARALWDSKRDRRRARTLAEKARQAYLAARDRTSANQVATWLVSR